MPNRIDRDDAARWLRNNPEKVQDRDLRRAADANGNGGVDAKELRDAVNRGKVDLERRDYETYPRDRYVPQPRDRHLDPPRVVFPVPVYVPQYDYTPRYPNAAPSGASGVATLGVLGTVTGLTVMGFGLANKNVTATVAGAGLAAVSLFGTAAAINAD